MIKRLFMRRRNAWLASLALLLLFPDAVLHVVLQVLHFVIGGLELTIEHVVQEALDVSRHTAQIITAWIGLVALVSLAAWLYRKLRLMLERARVGLARWSFQVAQHPAARVVTHAARTAKATTSREVRGQPFSPSH